MSGFLVPTFKFLYSRPCVGHYYRTRLKCMDIVCWIFSPWFSIDYIADWFWFSGQCPLFVYCPFSALPGIYGIEYGTSVSGLH